MHELNALAATTGKTVRIYTLGISDARTLFETLGMDTVPANVLPDKLLQGHLPAVVLDRYLLRD